MPEQPDNQDRGMTRAEKRAQTRQRLLESAAHVFAENGYERASVDDIAEHAGYSKGAVYSNFESKEDLFLALYDMTWDQAVALQSDDDPQGDPDERLSQEFLQLFRQTMALGDNWPLLLMEFWTYAARNPNLREKVAERSARRREALAERWQRAAEEQGFELPGSAQDIGSLQLALSDGVLLQSLLYPDRVTPEYMERVTRLLTSAITELGRSRGSK